MSNKSQLLTKGYANCGQVLSPEEVTRAREIMQEIFSKESEYEGDYNGIEVEGNPVKGKIYIDVFTRYPQLRWILTRPRLKEALASVLGDDFIFIPETSIMDTMYGGWHKDTTTQERGGHMFQWEKDYRVYQVAIYFQDNTEEYGGGLDVIPHSHKYRDRYVAKAAPSIEERIKHKLFRMKIISDPYKDISVASQAGDLVIFDTRLDHKATSPTKKPIPEKHRKFALFMVCSANNKHARTYTDYIKSRPDYHYLNNHKYPAELLADAKAHSLNLMEP